MTTLKKELENNAYPGRGIVVGRSEDGSKIVVAYFIMGRSENSRNRIFIDENDGIRTEAFDPAKLLDPSLIIYWPVRTLGTTTIVTNGDQTDTIRDYLLKEKTFANALQSRTFEPDPPNYTPRISALIKGCSYRLSIIKSANGNPDSVERFFFKYPEPVSGQGHFIHTYQCDGSPLPSFKGEPKTVLINGDIDSFTNEIWDSLNSENKVSLHTRFIDIANGTADTRTINKLK